MRATTAYYCDWCQNIFLTVWLLEEHEKRVHPKKHRHHVKDIRLMATITVASGVTINLQATPVDADGNATTDPNPISFEHDNNASLLTDNANGTCSIVPGVGTTNVTATDGTITSSVPFTIVVQPAGGPGAVADIVISQV